MDQNVESIVPVVNTPMKNFSKRYSSASDKINFQNAAVEIEAGTKIWSYKVDAMYKDATQAVKDLIDSKAQIDAEDPDDEEDAEDGSQEGGKEKKKKRKKLQEVTWKDEESQRITSKGNRPEKKNPYLQIKAAKLDSATDISALR